MDFCGEWSRFGDFENTVDRGSAVNFGANGAVNFGDGDGDDDALSTAIRYEYGNFFRKLPEIVESPKSEPFNQKFRKFRVENQMERKFPGKSFRKFRYTSRGFPPFGNYVNSQFSNKD